MTTSLYAIVFISRHFSEMSESLEPSSEEVRRQIAADHKSVRKFVHDINGEIFLIRGYADLTLGLLDDNETARQNLYKLLERTDELERYVRALREEHVDK